MTTPIELAIEELYARFPRSVRAASAEGCPCCVTAREAARLRSTPHRELGPPDLDRYGSKAMTTWGDAAMYRYLLPRILELRAVDPGASELLGFDDAVIGRKLDQAAWTRWSDSERGALAGFLVAWWAERRRVPIHDVVAWLEELGLPVLGDGSARLSACLDELVRDDGESAVDHLVELAIRGARDESSTLGRWLRSSAVRARLEDALASETDPARTADVAYALARLEG